MTKRQMTIEEFWDEYEVLFMDMAYETIMTNSEEYFDGYTMWTDEDYEEVFENHKDELLSVFLDEYNIEIVE